MSHLMQWMAVFAGEMVFVIFILLLIFWVRTLMTRRRDHQAIAQLITEVRKARDKRATVLDEYLQDRMGLSGEELENSKISILREETRLLQRFADVYKQRDAGTASQFFIDVEAAVAPYHQLSGGSVPAEPVVKDDTELVALRAENVRLTEELTVTMETMSRMLNEYATMFSTVTAEEGVVDELAEGGDEAEESVSDEAVAEEAGAAESMPEDALADEAEAVNPVSEDPVAEKGGTVELMPEEAIAEKAGAVELMTEEPVVEETEAVELVPDEAVVDETEAVEQMPEAAPVSSSMDRELPEMDEVELDIGLGMDDDIAVEVVADGDDVLTIIEDGADQVEELEKKEQAVDSELVEDLFDSDEVTDLDDMQEAKTVVI